MAQITEFGYLGVYISDPKAWKEYATQVVGMEWLDEGEGDRAYLRMDEWHHRIALHINGKDDLAYLGLRVAGPDELKEMEDHLKHMEVPFKVGSEDECTERHVLGLIKLEDPSGNPLEIFHGPHIEASMPFYPGRRMFGKFATGAGGIGHTIIRADNVDASQQFYSRVLGMRGTVEYKLTVGDGHKVMPYFMHCNERDHSIAFGLGPMEKRINHLMIEVTEIDDVGMTYDLVKRRKIPIAITLGKHSNDRMLSFYMRNPSGWLFEYGSGSRNATHQTEYYTKDIWGHEFVEPAMGMDRGSL
ncbi:MAG TPA: biphenyl-2,3-diol 1,2-dioxygenase [Candidatus Binataceae bacterium]|nr:biphenyl-2,3-diol 1,2-dioxygenase [Candidatus Binataceae bacterium]